MIKVIANVEREPGEKNFSCHMNVEALKTGILGTGTSAKAAIADMQNGWHDVTDVICWKMSLKKKIRRFRFLTLNTDLMSGPCLATMILSILPGLHGRLGLIPL